MILAPRAPSAGTPAALRAVRFVADLPDRSLVDRLVRGQGWIAVLGFLLIGIVAMQVSLLDLNAGIGRAVERSAAMERRNGELRAQVSRLSASERVQRRAAELGMVMPQPGAVAYLRAGRSGDAARAAEALRSGRSAPGSATGLAVGTTVSSAPPQPAGTVESEPATAMATPEVAGTATPAAVATGTVEGAP